MSHGMNNLVNIFTLNKMLLLIAFQITIVNCLENCLNSIKIAKKILKLNLRFVYQITIQRKIFYQ